MPAFKLEDGTDGVIKWDDTKDKYILTLRRAEIHIDKPLSGIPASMGGRREYKIFKQVHLVLDMNILSTEPVTKRITRKMLDMPKELFVR